MSQKKYWSKRKRYGYGWTPTTWQGWTVVGIWLLFVLGMALYLPLDSSEDESSWAQIFVCLVLLSVIPLVLIFYITGPKPKWRWGRKESDNKDEDF